MKERSLGTWAGLKITIVPLVVGTGSIGLWLVLAIVATAVLQRSNERCSPVCSASSCIGFRSQLISWVTPGLRAALVTR